jgi:uncharacterized surface protein with fasciclin (FAS1) repeats
MNRIVTLLAASALLVTACGEFTPPKPAESATTTGGVAKSDIVDTANGAGQFKTLVAALKAAELEATLRGPGPFTVFAPTDEAFAKLPAGTVEALLKPESKGKLQAILGSHVVAGKVMSTEAVKLSSAKTASGKTLKLDASSGSLKVGAGANVVKADIEASNGVIHVIDAVVIPE